MAKKLQDKLSKLSLDDLESYTVEVTLEGTKEITIPNKLTFIPSKYIIVNQKGQGTVSKGNSEWTKKSLFLKLESNVTSYRLNKSYTYINDIKVLEDVELVPADSSPVTVTVTFLK